MRTVSIDDTSWPVDPWETLMGRTEPGVPIARAVEVIGMVADLRADRDRYKAALTEIAGIHKDEMICRSVLIAQAALDEWRDDPYNNDPIETVMVNLDSPTWQIVCGPYHLTPIREGDDAK